MLEDLKRELRNREGYIEDLTAINQQIQKAVYDMEGVKGVRFDKPRVSTSEEQKEEARLDKIERYNELLAERNRIILQLRYIERILEELDEETREAVEMHICQGNTLRKTAMVFHMSKSGMGDRIDRELKKAEKRARPL